VKGGRYVVVRISLCDSAFISNVFSRLEGILQTLKNIVSIIKNSRFIYLLKIVNQSYLDRKNYLHYFLFSLNGFKKIFWEEK